MGILPWYATREEFKRALDFNDSSRDNAAIDRALEHGSREVERLCHRSFLPIKATRYFRFPDAYRATTSWRLWLEEDELISVTTLTVAGEAVAGYYLEPINTGPPYEWLEVNRSTVGSFTTGSTEQRNISIAGVFGYGNDTTAAGALSAAIATTAATTCSVTNSAAIGVGDVVLVDSEYLHVTGKSMVDTTQNLQTNMLASTSDTVVDVTDGTAFYAGEVLLLGSEKMLIDEVAGNNLIVKRGFDGTVAAAHTSPVDIYAPRTLTIVRGALGTTAATHLISASLSRHLAPGPVRALTLAEAINQRFGESSGMARTIGSGEAVRNASGAGLAKLRQDVYDGYARKGRSAAV